MEALETCSTRVGFGLTRKHCTLDQTETACQGQTLAFLGSFIIYVHKKYYNISTWFGWYKILFLDTNTDKNKLWGPLKVLKAILI